MPTVSVLLPLYHPRIDYLREALQCLKNQTFTDFEAILLNQPWDQDVRGKIEDFLSDGRFRFIQSETIRGIGENWNACLPEVAGEYIQYLFYDDLWEPQYLARAASILEDDPDLGFVAVNHSYLYQGEVRTIPLYDELQEFKRIHLTPGRHSGQEFLLWWMEQGLRPNIIGEPSFVMLRRSLVDVAGPFHRTMRQFLDTEYWTRCLASADFFYLPDTLGKFRVHSEGTSAQNEFAGKGIFERFDTLHQAVSLLPPEHRPRAARALLTALEQMVGRLFLRLREKRAVSGEGSGGLIFFCILHPILVIRAVFRAFFIRGKGSRTALFGAGEADT
jgi:glycosyltransferase involved in cell wall biosynthesis